jgi:hypothetical protein
MKLRKAGYLSPFTEVAGEGREAFHRERDCSESKSRVLDLEDICWMWEQGFVGWIEATNDGARTSDVRMSTIPLRIVLSISNRNLNERICRVSQRVVVRRLPKFRHTLD